MPVCDQCREELKTILRPMQVDIPVKDYFELFKVYALTSGLRLDSELAKTRFVASLSPRIDMNWGPLINCLLFLI